MSRLPCVILGVSLVLGLTLLVGCINIARPYPEKLYYVLAVGRPTTSPPPHDDTVLVVRAFHVSPLFEGRELVYRTGDLTYETDFYHQFLIAPGALITEDVRQWLARSGLFRYVTNAVSDREGVYRLVGRVDAIYGDYRVRSVPRAVLDLEFVLLRDLATGPQVVLTKTYHQDVACAGHSVDALVEGWSVALRHILTAFEGELKTVPLKATSAL